MAQTTRSVQMKLSSPWYEEVRSGRKIFEGRRKTDKTTSIRVGDQIIFSHNSELNRESFCKTVIAIHEYPTFEKALQTLGIERILPTVQSLEEGVEIYSKYVSITTQLAEGILIFELETSD